MNRWPDRKDMRSRLRRREDGPMHKPDEAASQRWSRRGRICVRLVNTRAEHAASTGAVLARPVWHRAALHVSA
jgi:hypothetical protein